MPGPHRGASTQHHNQQVLAKPQHQPSDRDQQAREKLRQKAKIKSPVNIQLGEEALQIVHKTFAPDIPVILYLPALVDNTIDTNTPPMLYVIQEGINCMPITDYFFTSIKPAPIVVTHPQHIITNQQSNCTIPVPVIVLCLFAIFVHNINSSELHFQSVALRSQYSDHTPEAVTLH